MTSNWALPTSIIQYAEPGAEEFHVPWLEVNNFYGLKNLNAPGVQTSRDLIHIAKQPNHDLVEKTYYLKLSGFNFLNLPTSVSGIEMRLSMKRHGRITDETIQLVKSDELAGDNQATLNLDPVKVYGSATDNWKTSISIPDIENGNFAVVIRFQSHHSWPHKTGAMVDAVEIRIH